MIYLLAGVLLGGLFAGAILHFYYEKREKKLLSRLQKMVDDAISGCYRVSGHSESQMSLLENSFKRYLDNSVITEDAQKEQKEMIQKLISDIAHQTLTPISNLKLYAGLLQENYPKDTLAETVSEETEKLDFLIQSLVKLSRMENGIIHVYPEKTPVRELLLSIQKHYRREAGQKEIKLVTEDTDALAMFDLKWTVEAVGNIVDNAIKYTSAGGKIGIWVQTYSLFVRVDISDTGIGIAEEEIPKIFSRFYRSFEVADLPGVGIGLYLARFIIQEQKGYIKVTSQKGKGSVFSVFLPCAGKNE